MSFDITSYLEDKKKLIDQQLNIYFQPVKDDNTSLKQSIRYSLTSGGKRLRPILCLAAAEAVSGEFENVLPVACAIEMIHTYSLVHDDLPAMDDDSLRRGKPTNHIVYGEAIAILTGDALFTEAFGIIVSEGKAKGLDPSTLVEIIREITSAVGSDGMVLGQAIDLELEGREDVEIETLKNMHTLKTGALIEASVVTGAMAGKADQGRIEHLRKYSKFLGLAYQIIDDVLDVEGGESLGKKKGSDIRKSKATYTSVLGVKRSRDLAAELTDNAVNSLSEFYGNTKPLKEIAYYLGKRKY